MKISNMTQDFWKVHISLSEKTWVLAPNKPERTEMGSNREKFIKAYVQDPQRGKHDWVYDLDITSMYPSIIMSLNISPETKIGKRLWDGTGGVHQ